MLPGKCLLRLKRRARDIGRSRQTALRDAGHIARRYLADYTGHSEMDQQIRHPGNGGVPVGIPSDGVYAARRRFNRRRTRML